MLKELQWDGRCLGTHSWRDIVLDWIPVCPKGNGQKNITFYAIISVNGEEIPVVFKSNTGRKVYQCVCDEVKGLFEGVVKMKTHVIFMDAKLHRTTSAVEGNSNITLTESGTWLDVNGNRTCIPVSCSPHCYYMFEARTCNNVILKEETLRNSGISNYKKKLARIYTYTNIIGTNDRTAQNIIVTKEGDLISISETYIRKHDEPLKYQGSILYKTTMGDIDQKKLFDEMTGGADVFRKRLQEVLVRLEENYKKYSRLSDATDFYWCEIIAKCRCPV